MAPRTVPLLITMQARTGAKPCPPPTSQPLPPTRGTAGAGPEASWNFFSLDGGGDGGDGEAVSAAVEGKWLSNPPAPGKATAGWDEAGTVTPRRRRRAVSMSRRGASPNVVDVWQSPALSEREEEKEGGVAQQGYPEAGLVLRGTAFLTAFGVRLCNSCVACKTAEPAGPYAQVLPKAHRGSGQCHSSRDP